MWLIVGLGLVLLCAALSFWLLGWPWVHHVRLATSARDAPSRDPLWWPWVCALEPHCEPFVTWAMRERRKRLLARAGADAARWPPARLLAAQLLCVGAAGVLVVTLAWLLDAAWRVTLVSFAVALPSGYLVPLQRLRRRAAARQRQMRRELPFMLDLLTLCVEAGLSLPLALREVAQHAPDGPLRQSLRRAAALERTGVARAQWLAHWAHETGLDGVRDVVRTLAQADALGMRLAPLLRAQAEHQQSARFQRAEARALQAPVKMLFPMVSCIFPCTFLVIGFPVAVKLLQAGA